VSSLYDCLVSEQVAGVPSELEEYARYILGAREFAANEFTHMSTILTLSQALQGIYAQNPGATFHMSLGCQSVGGNEDFQTIAFGETQTNEGLEESEANGEATEYTRYIIIPTTPKVAGFSGGGGNRIWVIEDEAALGEEGETYPTEGSCQRPLEWHGPLDPTDADDSLPSV
jgi:hypothetical protein